MAPGPRQRDLPDPVNERPSFMRQRARWLLRQSARLAEASTLADGQLAEIERLRDEAHGLLRERMQKLMDPARAVSRPATNHTAAAWGARPGEPQHEFPRALRRTLLVLGVSQAMADQLVDTGEGPGEGKKGEGKKGGKKGGGEKGKGKW